MKIASFRLMETYQDVILLFPVSYHRRGVLYHEFSLANRAMAMSGCIKCDSRVRYGTVGV